MQKRGKRRRGAGEHFRSAIADWQLELQTELKKASSLPTAMFDASDPMLEARLAAATEGLLRQLIDAPPTADALVPTDERKLETVPLEELAALFATAARAGAAAAPRLEEHQTEEFLAVLGDACLRAPAPQQQRARELLRQSGGGEAADLDGLAAALARRIVHARDSAELDAHELAAICHRIAAAVLQPEPPRPQP